MNNNMKHSIVTNNTYKSIFSKANIIFHATEMRFRELFNNENKNSISFQTFFFICLRRNV